MLGSFFNVMALAGFLVEIYVVVCTLFKKSFFSNIAINFYMLCEAAVTFGLFLCTQRYGTSSSTYAYYYYYTDSLLTILMFWVIISFYQQVFSELKASSYVRKAAVLLLLATAFFSYGVVHQNRNHLTSRFVVAMGQNLYFVGVVLTYLLWGAILKLRETRTRLVQLVLALGVYFSGTAGTYAIGNLFPHLYMPLLRFLFPIVGLWLPLAWAYTFTKVPEDSRLATASLLARAR
ncbi:MAG TPA: hypothetical protein VLY23_00380 [Candidatus Acidoferrum sp.]|nr:hypothetical protein [Candidatus Acidoferrum sp.]